MNKKVIGIIALVILGLILILVVAMRRSNSDFNDYMHNDYDGDTIDKSDIVVTSPAKEINEYTGDKVLDTAISEIESQYNYSFIAVADSMEDSITEQVFKYVLFESPTSERHEFVLRILKDGTVAVQGMEEAIH